MSSSRTPIRAVTVLELHTFIVYPTVRLKSSEFATFNDVTCLNLERVWVKSEFNDEGLAIQRTGTSKSEMYRGNQITELSIEEERNWHRPAIQDLFTEGIFKNLTHLSWTSLEPIA